MEGFPVKPMWLVSALTPRDSWPTRLFFCVDLTPLWKTGCQHSEHVGSSQPPWQDDWQLFYPPPRPSIPHRIPSSLSDLRNQPYRRADAVRRSVRRRYDDQNLRPVNNGEVVMWRGNSACAWEGEMLRMCNVEKRERQKVGRRLKDDKRKMTSVVATIEMYMYIYYIRIHVIPCLWYRSFSLWRTETCWTEISSVWKVDSETLDKPSAWTYFCGLSSVCLMAEF